MNKKSGDKFASTSVVHGENVVAKIAIKLYNVEIYQDYDRNYNVCCNL